MEVSREQLSRYASVICAWQAGNPTAEIATALRLPADLVTDWIANWRSLDEVAA